MIEFNSLVANLNLCGFQINYANIMKNSIHKVQKVQKVIRSSVRPLQCAAMLCALGTAASSAAADDGRITFTGNVLSTTCVVQGGGATVTNVNGGNFTVALPRVSVTALAAAGERAGDTPFYIRLSGDNCTNGAVSRVYFEPAQSTNMNSATGNLRNHTAAGAAGRVEVGLLNANRAAMNLFTNTPQLTATVANNTAQFDFWAQYVATGGATTAGSVNTDVVYSIVYN